MDADLRRLERKPVADLTELEFEALRNHYVRVNQWKHVMALDRAWNEMLPPLPVIVRRWRDEHMTELLMVFPTIPGSTVNWYQMSYIGDRSGSGSADYFAIVERSTPVTGQEPDVIKFVETIEGIDGRRVKLYRRNSYRFDRQREAEWRRFRTK